MLAQQRAVRYPGGASCLHEEFDLVIGMVLAREPGERLQIACDLAWARGIDVPEQLRSQLLGGRCSRLQLGLELLEEIAFPEVEPLHEVGRGKRIAVEDLKADLQVRFEEQAGGNQFGAPRDFDATVTYRAKPGAPAQRRTIKVNQPLDVDGARVFLVGNGYAPVITVTNHMGRVSARFDKVIARNRGSIEIPCTIRQIRPLDVTAIREAEKTARDQPDGGSTGT